MIPLPRTKRDAFHALTLAAAYAAAGVVTLSLPENVLELRRMIWPSSGIGLAWIMLAGFRLWPGVALGAGLATALTGGPVLHLFGTAVANTLEIVLAVMLLRAAGIRRQIVTRRDLAVFLSVVAGTTALAAALSVGSLAVSGQLGVGSVGPVWLNWWLTHAMGQVVLTPLILSLPWFAGKPPRVPLGETTLMLTGLGLSLVLVFTPLAPAPLRAAPLAFLCFPFLFWVAYRGGPFGASAASFTAAAFALTGTLLGAGPFVTGSSNTSLALTLLFVSTACFATLFVAGLVGERERAEAERKELERRLRRSEKLESLGALAGGIAHDFNNLLVAIGGNVDLVMMDTDPTDPAHELLDQSVRASERAAELCRQLLAYAGQGPFEHAVIDLRPLVEEMTELLRITLPAGTVVRYDLGPEVLPVAADISQLRRVVLNLFSNAGDAALHGRGRIEIRAWTDDIPGEELASGGDDRGESVTFLDPPEGPTVFLQVEDDGEGIREEDLERIFEPLFTTRGLGRGLGLASVLGIVRSHGGAIRVRSAPGRGARFTILLPRATARIEPVPLPPLQRRRSRDGLALIVDDEPAVRRAASMLVGRLGFDTVTAEDGPSALRLIEERGEEIGWALLDVTMPGLDGLETLRRLRATGDRTPVLLSSGYVLQPADITADLGPARFLPKPYTLSALERAIEDLLERSRRRSGAGSSTSVSSDPGKAGATPGPGGRERRGESGSDPLS
ncbi:MAG: MASE1 domain-containing protein [Gemmatimonadota bacterium]|nr:MASE1 domain-containing protein [Gemmatimonadota bacterium]